MSVSSAEARLTLIYATHQLGRIAEVLDMVSDVEANPSNTRLQRRLILKGSSDSLQKVRAALSDIVGIAFEE